MRCRRARAIGRALLLLGAACLLAARAGADASGPEVVRVGHWLEVRGQLEGDGLFRCERAEIVDPKRRERLVGTVSEADPAGNRFTLLGQPVAASEQTDWGQVTQGTVAGRRIKVRGFYLGPKRFSAREIDARDPGREEIGGRVDSIRRTAIGLEVQIMRFRVLLPEEVKHKKPLPEILLSPQRQGIEGQAESEDDLFGPGVLLARGFRLFGQIEARAAAEENFDLDLEDAEDRLDSAPRIRLRFEWDPSPAFGAVVEGRHRIRYRDDEKDGDSRRTETFLGETFVLSRDPFGVGLGFMVGRQDFDDRREWIYDQNLDGVRLILSRPGWRLEASATTTLSAGSERDELSRNFVAYLQRGNRKRHLALWSLHREVDVEEGESWTHLGFRALGDLGWVDLAYFTGKSGDVDLGGWGFDIGSTRSLGSGPVSVTAAYAYGSGGTQSDLRDRTFRQTGYQDNNGRFHGVTSFRYYGELFDPELANLHIATLGLGVRLPRRSSLDAVAHYYKQDDIRDRLVDGEIDRRPDGIHGELGWEADLILGVRPAWSWDLEAVLAYFHPGEAFQDYDGAYLGRLQLRYRF